MIKSFLKSNGVYAIGSLANSAVSLLLVPYMVNTLTLEEFGIWSLIEVSILILSLFMVIGMNIGLMREYWFLKDEEDRAKLTGTIFISVTGWGLILILLLLIFTVAGVTGQIIPASLQTTVLVLVVAFLETLLNLSLTLFRIREEPGIFVWLSFGRLVLYMLGAIALVWAGYGVLGAVTGRALASLIALIFGLWFIRHYVYLNWDLSYFKRVLAYGLPLLPANLAAYVLMASDRYFLQTFTAASLVAIYVFSYKIVSIFEVLINRPFALDWAPRRFKIATQPDPQQRYIVVLLVYFWVGIAASLGIIAISPFAFRLLAPPDYASGLEVVPVLMLSMFIYGLSYPLTIGIVLKDRTSYAAIIGIITAITCIGMNFWLIPIYGMMGAAWSKVIAYFFWTAGMAIVSLRLYRISYPSKLLIFLSSAAILGYLGLDQLLNPQFSGTPFQHLLISIGWLALVLGIAAIPVLRKIFTIWNQPVSLLKKV